MKKKALAISTNFGYIIIQPKLKKIIEKIGGISISDLATYLSQMGIKFPVELIGNGSATSLYDVSCFTVKNAETKVKFHINNSVIVSIEDTTKPMQTFYYRNHDKLVLREIILSYANDSQAKILCKTDPFHVQVLLTFKKHLKEDLIIHSSDFDNTCLIAQKATAILSTFFDKPFYSEKVLKKMQKNFNITK